MISGNVCLFILFAKFFNPKECVITVVFNIFASKIKILS
jgi:hypothetical protein